MSLEERIDANTAALGELTKAILGKPPGAVAGKPGAGKPAGAGKPKRSAEEVMAIAVKVKNEISKEGAKFLISKHGAENLKDLKPASYDAFYADCESAIEAGEVEGMEDPDGGL